MASIESAENCNTDTMKAATDLTTIRQYPVYKWFGQPAGIKAAVAVCVALVSSIVVLTLAPRHRLGRQAMAPSPLLGTQSPPSAPGGRPAADGNVGGAVTEPIHGARAGAPDVNRLSAQLFDPGASLADRRRAAWDLGRLGSDEAVELLHRALAAAPTALRATIAEALGNSRNPRAGELILTLLRDADLDVARGALRGLARIADAAALQRIGGVLRDPGAALALRGEAALALGVIEHPAARTALREAAAEASAELLPAVLTGLGHAPFSENESFYRAYLNAPNGEVALKAAALESLGHSTGDAVPLLLDFMGADHEELRAAAAWALANIDSPGEFGGALSDRLAVEPAAGVRARIYQALENQKALQFERILPVILNDDDNASRLAGFTMMAAHVGRIDDAALRAQFNQSIRPRLKDLAANAPEAAIRLRAQVALRRADGGDLRR